MPPFHALSQIATPRTMGSNSLTVIWSPSQVPGHCSWSHWPPDVNAPQPQDPEASEVSVAWKRPRPKLDIGHDPFQISRKQPHHLRSERKPELRRTRWCSSCTLFESSIIRRRKDLPGLITEHACWSCPIMDKSSCLVQDFRFSHRRIPRLSRTSLGVGNCTVIETVSSSIPKKVMTELGLSVFLAAIGTPRTWQRARALAKACSHCWASGAPNSRKSSR